MKIPLNYQAEIDATLPLLPVRIYTGSSLPMELVGIPTSWSGGNVTAVKVSVKNADGATVTGDAVRVCNEWRIIFAASNFTNYGSVSKGVRVSVTVSRADGSSADVILAVADFEIVPATASAQPGDPSAHYQRRGDDEYFKSYVAAGVQHFVKQVVSYDPQIGWGADWSGDYILVNGEFVEYTEV